MVDYKWSCVLGKFVDKVTGVEVTGVEEFPMRLSFNGDIREWYETLVEVIYDVVNTITRNFLADISNVRMFCSPDVHSMLESSVLYGQQLGCGITLTAEQDIGCGKWIDFVDQDAGEVVGRVEVLDLP